MSIGARTHTLQIAPARKKRHKPLTDQIGWTTLSLYASFHWARKVVVSRTAKAGNNLNGCMIMT